MNTVLGVYIEKDHLRLAIVKGSYEKPLLIQVPENKIVYPPDFLEPGERLAKLSDHLKALIQEQSISHLAILIPSGPAGWAPSDFRVKLDGALQQMCYGLGIKNKSSALSAFRNASRKFDQHTRSTPEDLMNNGKPIKPKALRDACLCAWTLLLSLE